MSGRSRTAILCALLLAAFALVAVGVSVGEPSELMQKAVRVCLECIGIG